MNKDKKSALITLIMVILLCLTSYYIGYGDGNDQGTLDGCNMAGGTLYFVKHDGLQCLNGSLKDSQTVLDPLNGGLYGD